VVLISGASPSRPVAPSVVASAAAQDLASVATRVRRGALFHGDLFRQEGLLGPTCSSYELSPKAWIGAAWLAGYRIEVCRLVVSVLDVPPPIRATC